MSTEVTERPGQRVRLVAAAALDVVASTLRSALGGQHALPGSDDSDMPGEAVTVIYLVKPAHRAVVIKEIHSFGERPG